MMPAAAEGAAPLLRLYSFFNSSTAFRVRIALALKGLPFELVTVNLRAGEQHGPAYADLNPAHLVPMLRDGEGRITQSIAIIDHLDRIAPRPLLLPVGGPERTRVLEAAMVVAADMHQVNNMRTLRVLREVFAATPAQTDAWMARWWATGFEALEALLPPSAAWAMAGEAPTLVDCCLVPQVANAERGGFDLRPYPKVWRAYCHGMAHPAFKRAAPSAQPDFVAAH